MPLDHPRRTTSALRGWLVALLVLALSGVQVPPAEASARELQRIEANKSRIAKLRTQVEAERADKAGSLSRAQERVAEILAAVSAAEAAVQRQEQAVAGARSELESLREREVHQRRMLRNRAVSLYKSGTGVPFGPILAAASPTEAIRRSVYVDVVSRTDQRRFEGVTIAQVAVEQQRRQLEAEEEGLAAMLAAQRRLLAEVESVRDSRAAALAGVAKQLSQLQSQERHLEAESRRVAALSRRSSGRSSRSVGVAVPGRSAGGWTWPANGPVTSEYGPRWGRTHEGIDIGGGTGAPIFAARAGRVTYTGSMSGYGNLTLIDHGGGLVTAYAHQSRFLVRRGEQVALGQRIGSIGCTGSCTGPHLHFEVRVNGSPQNPRRYLP